MKLNFVFIPLVFIAIFAISASADYCCAPTSFYARAITPIPYGSVQHEIYYNEKSSANGQPVVYWSRNYLVGSQNYTISTWTNYTTLNEYVYDSRTGQCEPYGADAFYPWCYGSVMTQKNIGQISVNSGTAQGWTFANVADPTFLWWSTSPSPSGVCLPLTTIQRGGATTNFYNVIPNYNGPFNIPSICTSASAKVLSHSTRENTVPFRYGRDIKL